MVGINHMFGSTEARVVKFCMHVGYVKSHHNDEKSRLKGAWSESRDPLYILTPPMISLEQILRAGRLCQILAYGDKLPPKGAWSVY